MAGTGTGSGTGTGGAAPVVAVDPLSIADDGARLKAWHAEQSTSSAAMVTEYLRVEAANADRKAAHAAFDAVTKPAIDAANAEAKAHPRII